MRYLRSSEVPFEIALLEVVMYYFNNTFRAFLDEASFTKEILGIGVTQLYKANYAKKGIYFQSFVCLSTGIERLEKLCLILSYCISHNGIYPSEKEIRQYGHNLRSLFNACQNAAKKNEITFRFPCPVNDELHTSILDILSEFASSQGRYSNINAIVGSNDDVDCINRWHNDVDMVLYKTRVSPQKKNTIENNAILIGEFMNEFTMVLHTGENRRSINEAIEASRMTGVWEAVAPYRQLYVLHIIRYLTELIMKLGYLCVCILPEDIPSFGEIFGLFYNDDSFFRSRKTWDNL